MRTTSTQLPTKAELLEMLAREESRTVPPGKEHVHYPDFSAFTELLDIFSIQRDFWDEDITLDSLTDEHILKAAQITDTLVTSVLESKIIGDLQEKLDDLYLYLSAQDKPEKADIIFVFGSDKPYRIEKAIELHKAGYGSRIMISGGQPSYIQEEREPEALRHKRFAIEQGVPEKDIIVETKSISIPGNVKSSLNLLEKENIPFSTVILVNSPFASHRGFCHFKKFSPEEISFYKVNCFASEPFAAGSWYAHETGIRTIIKEFFSMKMGVITNTA